MALKDDLKKLVKDFKKNNPGKYLAITIHDRKKIIADVYGTVPLPCASVGKIAFVNAVYELQDILNNLLTGPGYTYSDFKYAFFEKYKLRYPKPKLDKIFDFNSGGFTLNSRTLKALNHLNERPIGDLQLNLGSYTNYSLKKLSISKYFIVNKIYYKPGRYLNGIKSRNQHATTNDVAVLFNYILRSTKKRKHLSRIEANANRTQACFLGPNDIDSKTRFRKCGIYIQTCNDVYAYSSTYKNIIVCIFSNLGKSSDEIKYHQVQRDVHSLISSI